MESNEGLIRLKKKQKQKQETKTNVSDAVAIIRPEVMTRSCVNSELLNLRQMKPFNSAAMSCRGPSPKFD